MMINKFNILYRLARLFIQDPQGLRIIWQVHWSKLTYLEINALLDLHDTVKQIEYLHQKGILIEAGCALGGSALVIASAKQQKRPLYLFDAFDMIPAPTDKDEDDAHSRYEKISSGKATGIGNDIYYGYQENLLLRVKNNFQKYGFSETQDSVNFVKGFYQNTLNIDEDVAMAHLDCDWYHSVMVCLERIVPRLVPGGVLVIDDYEAWAGCKKAVDEYFAHRKDEFDFIIKSRLHIIRKW